MVRSRSNGSRSARTRDREPTVDLLADPPRLTALVERAVARQQLVESRVRGLVDADRRLRRADAVAALDLVHVRDVRAGEHVRVGGTATHLVAKPAVVELAEERVRVRGELLRGDPLLRVDLRLKLRGP